MLKMKQKAMKWNCHETTKRTRESGNFRKRKITKRWEMEQKLT